MFSCLRSEKRPNLLFSRNPNHIGLKLSYLIFLTEKLQKMSIAYENIYIIETGPNTLDITSRYILKTLKKQIDEADEEKTKLRHESVNPENLQNSTRSGTRLKVPKMVKERITIQMHKHLEKATTDFMGLWQTVNEENSKINKISFAVKQAHKNISNSRSFWAKNFKAFLRTCRETMRSSWKQ